MVGMSETSLTLRCKCGCEVLRIDAGEKGMLAVELHGALSILCRECLDSKVYLIGKGAMDTSDGALAIIAG